MLHIILLILKIIGIILGSVLALALLLICAVLFVSIKYRASVSYNSDFKYWVKVHWIPGLAGVKVSNESGNNQIVIRFLGFSIFDSTKEKRPKKVKTKDAKESEPVEIVPVQKEIIEAPSETEIVNEQFYQIEEKTNLENDKQIDEHIDKQIDQKSEKKVVKKKKAQRRNIKKRKEKKGIVQKVRDIKSKIKQKLNNISDTCKNLKSKKEQVFEIIFSEHAKKTIQHIKRRFIKILKHLRFKKLKGWLHYGFDDPGTTGKVLAVLGILYPIYSPGVTITPDFENQVIEGDLYIRGRIRLFNLLLQALMVVADQNVRKMIKDLKMLKGG